MGSQPVAKKGHFEMDVKKINELFRKELVVINLGLDSFADNLRKEEVKVLQMDWRPPAGGNERLIALLEKLEG
jgi:FdrA protein